MSKAFTCSISGEPLVDPVVCCRLGYLYSKENILSALLDKRLNETFSHVKRMKVSSSMKGYQANCRFRT